MKKYLVFLLILSIFLSGCSGLNLSTRSNDRSNDGPLTGSPNGIKINFLEQPPKIISGNKLQIPIELVNNAACDAVGKLCVSDSAPDSVGGLSQPLCQDFTLDGAEKISGKQVIPKGKFYFETSPYNLENSNFKERDYTLFATVTYRCGVVAEPTFCVAAYSQGSSCKSSEVISGSNLGAAVAPITVTKVEKFTNSASGGATVLTTITLSKMSKGYIINELDATEQSNTIQGEPISIYVDIDGNPMECSGLDSSGKLYWKTDDQSKEINCKSTLNFADTLDAHLKIGIDFFYKTTESKAIKVTNPLI